MNVAEDSRIPALSPPPSSPAPRPSLPPHPTSRFSWVDVALALACAGLLSAGVRSMGLWPAVELAFAERAGGQGIGAGRAVSIAATLWCGLALHQLFARIASMGAARLALVMVVCVPILAARARLVGDGAVGMAATTTSFVGFTLALRERDGARPWVSWLWLALGAASAMAATKLMGPALGLFAPAAAAALDRRSSLPFSPDRLPRGPGQIEHEHESSHVRVSRLVSIAVVSLSAAVGVALFARMPQGTLPPGSFDRPLTALAHETFPLSALLPILLAVAVGDRTKRRHTASSASSLSGKDRAVRTSLLFLCTLFVPPRCSPSTW